MGATLPFIFRSLSVLEASGPSGRPLVVFDTLASHCRAVVEFLLLPIRVAGSLLAAALCLDRGPPLLGTPSAEAAREPQGARGSGFTAKRAVRAFLFHF